MVEGNDENQNLDYYTNMRLAVSLFWLVWLLICCSNIIVSHLKCLFKSVWSLAVMKLSPKNLTYSSNSEFKDIAYMYIIVCNSYYLLLWEMIIVHPVLCMHFSSLNSVHHLFLHGNYELGT